MKIKTANPVDQKEIPESKQSHQKQDDFEKIQEHMTEMELIRSKKVNLIVHNLPETEDNAKSAADMVAEEFKIKIKIFKATHMGRINEENLSKPRLLKIEMKSAGDRRIILSRAKELRSSKHPVYTKVYIRSDLKKRQLARSKSLRATLSLMKAESH